MIFEKVLLNHPFLSQKLYFIFFIFIRLILLYFHDCILYCFSFFFNNTDKLLTILNLLLNYFIINFSKNFQINKLILLKLFQKIKNHQKQTKKKKPVHYNYCKLNIKIMCLIKMCRYQQIIHFLKCLL